MTIICGIVIYLVQKRSKQNFASKQNEKSHKKEKQAVFQLILIIVAFLIGYVPFIGNIVLFFFCECLFKCEVALYKFT